MTFEIREIASLRLLGLRRTGEYRKSVPTARRSLLAIARRYQLIDESTQFLGLSYDSPELCEAPALRFDACISTDAAPVDELRRIEVDGGLYAVYRHTGAYEFLEHVFDRLFDAVIFSGAYNLREAPCIEFYMNDPENVKREEYVTDVCIPVAQ